MTLVDHELATHLERAEGTIGASFTDARNAHTPIGATWRDVAGTIAVFDGEASPLSQTFGLGMSAPTTDEQLAALEDFFASRGADTMHEVCPYAGVETLALLAARGHRPIELSNVLVLDLAEPDQLAPPSSSLRARAMAPGRETAAWVDASVRGWSSEPEVAAFIRSLAEVNVDNQAMRHFLVEHEGEVVATASMGVHGPIALLAGASTLPAARGRGAQSVLLAHRLIEARRLGCAVAMMVAAVGSTSQHNAERRGFRVAYTRTKWRRPR